MGRSEAIALITAKLASLDDEHLLSLAEMVSSMQAETGLQRPLSSREKRLIEQSKADFASGRTLSLDELAGMLDARLAPLGVPKTTR